MHDRISAVRGTTILPSVEKVHVTRREATGQSIAFIGPEGGPLLILDASHAALSSGIDGADHDAAAHRWTREH